MHTSQMTWSPLTFNSVFKCKDKKSSNESAIVDMQAINVMTQLQFKVGFWRIQKGFTHMFHFNYNLTWYVQH